MSQPTQKELAALREVISMITDAVKVAGTRGAPGGVMYAALSTAGCTLDQFNSIMGAMVSAGRLIKRGELYFLPETQASA